MIDNNVDGFPGGAGGCHLSPDPIFTIKVWLLYMKMQVKLGGGFFYFCYGQTQVKYEV